MLRFFHHHDDGQTRRPVGFLERWRAWTSPPRGRRQASLSPTETINYKASPKIASHEPSQKTIHHGLPTHKIRPRSPHRTPSETSTLTVDGNPDSVFLSRLPIEVRLLIYEYVFGDHKTFLFIHGNYAPRSALPPRELSIDSHEWTSYPFVGQREMSLLRTCRQIHQEGLATAVNSSIFYLKGPVGFSQLENRCLRRVRQERLGQICHLDVQWVFRNSDCEHHMRDNPRETAMATWEQIWGVIAANTRLKSLQLRLVYIGPEDQMRIDASWLDPLRQVRGIKSVMIDIRYFERKDQVAYDLNGYLWKIMSAGKETSSPKSYLAVKILE